MLTKFGKFILKATNKISIGAGSTYEMFPTTIGLLTNTMDPDYRKTHISATDIAGVKKYLAPFSNYNQAVTLLDFTLSTSLRFGENNDAVNLLGASGVYLGKGLSPESEEDFTIDFIKASNSLVFQKSSTGCYRDSINNCMICYADYSIANPFESPLTISEYGSFVKFKVTNNPGEEIASGNQSSTNTSSFMLERTLLDSPLIIPVGEAGSLRIKHVFDYSDWVDDES